MNNCIRSIHGKQNRKFANSKRKNIGIDDSKQKYNLVFENQLLYNIIGCASNGIVVIDSNKNIIFCNHTAREIFEIPPDIELLNHKFIEVVRNYNVNLNIDTCIAQSKAFKTEIFYFTNEQKQLKISFHPTGLLNPEGCIMFIDDITTVKKLEQIRTEFVSNVTHELKTPLTSIRGFVETLRGGAINDTFVAKNFLEIIDIESERLYNLINDILHLSEIESRQKDDNISHQTLLPMVEEVFEILNGSASKKNVTLKHLISPKISVEINPYRLKQLLINLIDNAIKYNKENGQVIVSCSESIGKISICVEDSGIGIPEEHHKRLFERFYTVDKSRSRKLGGTGLGLSIVKHIVNLYDGNIHFISETDKGTRFIIEFPVTKFSRKKVSGNHS